MTETLGKAPDALPEFCSRLADECLGAIENPESLRDEETVHVLRVATKRLRAAWTLVKNLDAERSRQRRLALREMSALLSSSRDAAVLEKAARELQATATDPKLAKVFGDLAEMIRTNRVESSDQPCPIETHAAIRSCLDTEREAWKGLDRSHPQQFRKAVRKRLRRSKDRARRLARQSQKSKDPDLWHQWRKAIKRLRYQREFVARADGRQLGKIDARISRIGSRLGERNDLANLLAEAKKFAEEGRFSGKEWHRIRNGIADSERKLLGNCRRLGRRFLANRS